MRFAENSIISYLLEWSTSRRLWASIVLVTCWPLFLAAQGPSTVPDAQTTNDETPRPDPQTQAVDADTNPRATFALFQLDDSVWKYFQDGKELQTDEWEPIYQLLHVLTRIDAWQRFRWSQPIPEWRSIDIAPDQSRGLMYQLSGHVRSWQRHDLPAEVAKRFGYDHFYQVEMISSLEQRPIVLCVRSLPTNWYQAKTDGSASEFPVRCDGVFLKTGDADGENEKTSLIFATDHLAWYPSDESTALGVSIGRAMLGANQMDVTLFDTLDPQPRLSDRDQECFYQMLATVRRIALSTPKIDPRPPELSIDTALGSPERLTGDLVRLQGTARRAIRIAIDNVELSTRLGIDHYYEVECVLPLKDSMVDRESGVRYNRFPVTICIPQLPTNLPQGDDIRADIECDAFFLKLWSYRNAFLSQELSASRAVTGTSTEQLGRESSPVRQISPLLIGVSMQVAKPIEPSQNTWSTWTLIGLLLTFLVGILLYRLLTQHGDKQLQSWRNNHDLPNQLGDRLKNS